MKPYRIVIGLPLIGDGHWSGGLNYQRSLLQLIAGPLADRISARVIVSPGQEKLAMDSFGPWLEKPLIVDSRATGAGRGWRIAQALMTGRDKAFSRLATEHGIDVMFETARYFGANFPIPLLVWFPDFQHRHLGKLFSPWAWLHRELGFRAQGLGSRMILLSSKTAQADCEHFYPKLRGRTSVARFTGKIELLTILEHAKDVRAKYGLPEQFFYLPNQFWVHKNHAIVLDALIYIRAAQNGLSAMPPIVMSGDVKDHRDLGLFTRVMAKAQTDGLSPWFRHLGLIPYEDVLALNAASLAVLNPSYFEGWASSVEESKSLGTTLILSDIPVHKEQAPGAYFFPKDAPSVLADVLRNVLVQPGPTRSLTESLATSNQSRMQEFAVGFLSAIERCFALDKNNDTKKVGKVTV